MPPPASTLIGLNYPTHRHAAPRPQPLSSWIILTTGMQPPASTFTGLNYPTHRHAAPGLNLYRVELSYPPAFRPPVSTFIELNYPNHRHAAPRPQPLSSWIILSTGIPPPGLNLYRVELSYPPAFRPPASTFIGLKYPNHRHAAPRPQPLSSWIILTTGMPPPGLNLYRVELS